MLPITACRTLLGVLAASALSFATLSTARAEPAKHVYREVDGRSLNAFVFQPTVHTASPRSAILLFHGGGWAAGSAEWTFSSAQRFADLGLVAIAVDYRLSNERTTPADALEDTCAAFAWTRAHAGEFHLDTQRIAGYGVSAGGQLLGAAATGRCTDANLRPSALVLVSPPVDVAADRWFEKLLRGHGAAKDYSPVEHVDARTPPVLIIQGAADTLTPLRGAEKFCSVMRAAGRICELAVYENVGHLLTRNLKNQEDDFDPDPKASTDAVERQKRFLREHRFLPSAQTTPKK